MTRPSSDRDGKGHITLSPCAFLFVCEGDGEAEVRKDCQRPRKQSRAGEVGVLGDESGVGAGIGCRIDRYVVRDSFKSFETLSSFFL